MLAGQQERLRTRSLRAFVHLQRLLVVDDEVSRKWSDLFVKREEKLEKLGAVHLLWHGIYAFKIDDSGAATDLVFNDAVDVGDAVSISEGLVLTEWKKVKDPQEAGELFRRACKQTDNYKRGPLAATQLMGYRFIVLVSVKQLTRKQMPKPVEANGLVYYPINIAVDPLSASADAKQ